MTTTDGAPDDDCFRQRVVVFDLDDTLVAGDSFAWFLKARISGNLLRAAATVLTAPAWIPSWALRRTRVAAERYLIWLASVGLDDPTYEAEARTFAAEHAGPAGGRTSAPALACVQDHLDGGDRVLVVTACAAPVAQAVCEEAGLVGVEVVASTMVRSRWRFPRRVEPVRGIAKLRALEALGVQLPVEHAYSDSHSDLPLLMAARTPHVVNPSARDLRRLREALGQGLDVLDWHQD